MNHYLNIYKGKLEYSPDYECERSAAISSLVWNIQNEKATNLYLCTWVLNAEGAVKENLLDEALAEIEDEARLQRELEENEIAEIKAYYGNLGVK